MGHLRGYLITGNVALKTAFTDGFQKASQALKDIVDSRSILTATLSLIVDDLVQHVASLDEIIATLLAAGLRAVNGIGWEFYIMRKQPPQRLAAYSNNSVIGRL